VGEEFGMVQKSAEGPHSPSSLQVVPSTLEKRQHSRHPEGRRELQVGLDSDGTHRKTLSTFPTSLPAGCHL
jgi:hypothetical protein